VNPGWDRFVDNDLNEIHKRAIRQEQERQANLNASQAKADRSRSAPPASLSESPEPAETAEDAAGGFSTGDVPSSDAPQWPPAEAQAKLDPRRIRP
jgi:hypothetical protein